MNKSYWAITTLLFGAMASPVAVRAQDIVNFPKDPASWTVNVAPSNAPDKGSPPAGEAVLKEDVSQDDKKRRTELTAANGKTNTVWFITATHVLLIKTNGFVMGMPVGGGGENDLPYTESAFGWIKPNMLVGKDPVSYGGKSCFHYKGKVHLRATDNSGPRTITEEAWIDSKTLLPVALDDNSVLATYTFQPPPYPALTLPPEYQPTFDRLSR